ncbi:AAA family ATPase [Frankia sp. CNm7]|uniref:AAA family ATPase n=1 Tax=Frankia nepalensis TaxID=1836974 RepID=A0A937RN58_9ACTN|nr:AAA family ATPase [Frankia nepalensis]MBL7497608.1 AAA family ATPase [Frankia nepalensis]MBL7511794.1 AAA family ATPase [Frankia nepalensis]MBL7518605.1 AAA family ATPase [Frankia nepalensis]MBL7633260.1 AAA family ATPase [Frankia nepalensis]
MSRVDTIIRAQANRSPGGRAANARPAAGLTRARASTPEASPAGPADGSDRPDRAATGPVPVRGAERERVAREVDRLRWPVPGAAGRILEISGEPGIGKTFLLAEITEHARAQGVTVLSERCTEFEQDIPFGVLAGVLAERLTTEALAGLPPVTAEVLTRNLGPQGALGAAEAPAVPADSTRFSLYRAARTLLEQLAGGGLLLVLDDFHWADDSSVEFLDYLIRRPVEAPLLVVVAHRGRQAHARLRSSLARGVALGTVERLELRGLSLAEAAQVTGLPARSQRLRDLHRDSSGNPLYLLALARAGAHTGSASRLPVGDAVFDRYAALVLGDLAIQGGAQGCLVDAAAVLGDRFDLPGLAAVADLDATTACATLTELVRRDVLRPVEGTPQYCFRHPFLRMLVYANIDPCWRVPAHRRARLLLAEQGAPAGELAVHIERSLAGSDADDLAVLTLAAQDAARSDPRLAARWLRVALRVLPRDAHGDVADPDREFRLRLLLAQALGASGRLADSRDILHEILRASPVGSPGPRVEAVTFCSLMECLLGRYEEARALVAAELELGGRDRPADALRMITAQGIAGVFDGQLTPEADVAFAVRTARARGDRTALVGALALDGLNATLSGDKAAALRTVASCASLVDGLPDTELARHPEYVAALAWTETYLGRTDGAERHFRRGMALSARAGQRHVRPLLLVGLSVTCYRVGRLAEAQQAAGEARELAREIDAHHIRGLALALTSLCGSWTDPRATRAVSIAEQAVGTLRGSGSWWSYVATISLANATTIAGDPERCVGLLVTAGGGPDLPSVPSFLRSACQELLMTALENIQGSRPAPDWVEQLDGPLDADALALSCEHGYARTVHAHVVRARLGPAAAAELYENAAASFAAAGMVYLEAWALILAAKCAAAVDRTPDAAVMFQRARELARECGATSIYEEADKQQRRLAQLAADQADADRGARAGRATESPLAVLTEREREIARIAGTGKKTRDIAAELYLSPRTVDVHLTRIYRKLNVPSRAALARLMSEID